MAARKAALHFSLSAELIPASDTPSRAVSSEEMVAPEQEAPAFAMAVSIVDLMGAGAHDSAEKDALKLVAARQEVRCAETSMGTWLIKDRKRTEELNFMIWVLVQRCYCIICAMCFYGTGQHVMAL